MTRQNYPGHETRMNQLSFISESGELLRDRGIKQAVDHAESIEDGWQEKALGFLFIFIQTHYQFAIEDIRADAERFNQVPDPPSRRAWGGVAREAARRGWIRKVGYTIVKNPLAHCTPVTLWEACL